LVKLNIEGVSDGVRIKMKKEKTKYQFGHKVEESLTSLVSQYSE